MQALLVIRTWGYEMYMKALLVIRPWRYELFMHGKWGFMLGYMVCLCAVYLKTEALLCV